MFYECTNLFKYFFYIEYLMHKKVLAVLMAIAIIAAVGLTTGPIQKVTSVYATDGGNAKKVATTRDMPSIQWHSLKGITLGPGEFLDLADTTPFLTTKGHVAMYTPCDSAGHPKVAFLQGIVDVGVNTLAPVDPEYLSQLSTPGQNCLYHFDIGTPDGVTDFAIINDGHSSVTFEDRNTITFSFAEGLKKLG